MNEALKELCEGECARIATRGIFKALGRSELLPKFAVLHSELLTAAEHGFWSFHRTLRKISGESSYWKLTQAVRFGYRKACCADNLEKYLYDVRAREFHPGTAEKIFSYALTMIDQAENEIQLQEAYGLGKQKLMHVPQDELKEVLSVALSRRCRFLERKLGELGACAVHHVFFSDWLHEHLLPFLRPKNLAAVPNPALPEPLPWH